MKLGLVPNILRWILKGTNRIGVLNGIQVTRACQKTIVGGACAAEDVISESTTAGTHWVWSDVVRVKGGGGYITKAQVIIQTTALTPRITIFLYSKPPADITTVLNDNAANVSPTLGELPYYLDQIDIPACGDLGGMSIATATPSTSGNLPLPFTCDKATKSLYGIVVTRDAVTPGAADKMEIRLTIDQY